MLKKKSFFLNFKKKKKKKKKKNVALSTVEAKFINSVELTRKFL